MSDVRPHHVTALLVDRWGRDERAIQKLLPLVHDGLRRIASRHMAGERPDHLRQSSLRSSASISGLSMTAASR